MTKLKLFFMLSMLLGGLLLNTQRAAAQSEEEFTAEFNQYASNHTADQLRDYVLNRIAGLTTQAMIESELEIALLNYSFDFFAGGVQLSCGAADLRQLLSSEAIRNNR